MDLMRKGPLSRLKGDQVGLSFRFQPAVETVVDPKAHSAKKLEVINGRPRNMWIFDWRRFSNRLRNPFPGRHPYRNVARDQRKFAIGGYRAHASEMQISEEDLGLLEQISEELEARTVFILSTENGFAEVDATGAVSVHVPDKYYGPDNTSPVEFDIEGSSAMVISKSPDEPLPYELYVRRKFDRPDYVLPRESGEVIVESGRYYIGKRRVERNGLRMMQQFAAIGSGLGAHSIVFFVRHSEADEKYKERGFKLVESFGEYGSYKANIVDFLSNTLRNDFPDEALLSEHEDRSKKLEAVLKNTNSYPNYLLLRLFEQLGF